jgi:hypothetical protein
MGMEVDVCLHNINTPLFGHFPLCLSRACLGKMIIFSIKGSKERRFSHRIRLTRHAQATSAALSFIVPFLVGLNTLAYLRKRDFCDAIYI